MKLRYGYESSSVDSPLIKTEDFIKIETKRHEPEPKIHQRRLSRLSNLSGDGEKVSEKERIERTKLALERKYEARRLIVKNRKESRKEQQAEVPATENNVLNVQGNKTLMIPSKYKNYNSGNIATASYDLAAYTLQSPINQNK